MTTYTPDLADEVLVMYGVYRGGVGTVVDITDDRGFLVEGLLPDGRDFSRWHVADDLAPAEWGTWYIEITTDGNPRTLLRTGDIADAPIEPLEMILDGMRDAPWFIVDARGGQRVAVATRNIETVEVVVTARRDHR